MQAVSRCHCSGRCPLTPTTPGHASPGTDIRCASNSRIPPGGCATRAVRRFHRRCVRFPACPRHFRRARRPRLLRIRPRRHRHGPCRLRYFPDVGSSTVALPIPGIRTRRTRPSSTSPPRSFSEGGAWSSDTDHAGEDAGPPMRFRVSATPSACRLTPDVRAPGRREPGEDPRQPGHRSGRTSAAGPGRRRAARRSGADRRRR